MGVVPADTGQGLLPDPVTVVLTWGRRYVLRIYHLGLACCAVEFVATTMSRPDMGRRMALADTATADPATPNPPTPDPAAAVSAVAGSASMRAVGPVTIEVMVVSGTVTDLMAPGVRRLYELLPAPRYVLSFGACSNSGGPYWDSYSVTKGVDQLIPVDVYVPGCPPRPEAFMHGLLRLQDKIAAGSARPRPPTGPAALTAPRVPPPEHA